jgi:hypothetical protein
LSLSMVESSSVKIRTLPYSLTLAAKRYACLVFPDLGEPERIVSGTTAPIA